MTQRAAAIRRLAAAGCIAADEEAAELLVDGPDDATLELRLRRREDGEPLSWITGTTAFGDLRVIVRPGVYEPRPQSAELARRAAARLPAGGVAVDLCTGSGAIGVHLRSADPNAVVVGVDVDPSAAACARANGLLAVAGDVDAPIATGRVDLVTAVAPYVPTAGLGLLPADVQQHEPRRALDGGPDGLVVLRRVAVSAARLLRPSGWLLLEVGDQQAARLRPDLDDLGFTPPTTWADEEGDVRGLEAQRA